MNISIFGLGYVGCVAMGCLAEMGNKVIGVDVSQSKVNLINDGLATIVEKDIDELIKKHSELKNISATENAETAILAADVALISVGTPNELSGHLDMKYMITVANEIGKTLRNKDEFFTIAIRSTVMPGTNRLIKEIIKKKAGHNNFGVVSNPEFLREGSAVKDFFNPPYSVIASDSKKALKVMQKLYSSLGAEVIISDIGTAELIKFVNNSYHGLKVAFANEVGRICKSLGADSRKLMDLFVKDEILNISPAYFKPGFAYGGSCLPKDLKALNTMAHDNYLSTPILSSVANSNNDHIAHAFRLIEKQNKRKIGFLGISFKPGTDDLRFSPSLELVEKFIGKGYLIKVYDENVHLSRLLGKNKEYLFNKLPHIDQVLVGEFEDFLIDLEVLIIVSNYKWLNNFKDKFPKGLVVIDLTDSIEGLQKLTNYIGISW